MTWPWRATVGLSFVRISQRGTSLLALVAVTGCVGHQVREVPLPPSPETMVSLPEVRAVRLSDGASIRFRSVSEMRWVADSLVIRGEVSGEVDHLGSIQTITVPVGDVVGVVLDPRPTFTAGVLGSLGVGAGAVVGTFLGIFLGAILWG